MVSKVNNRYIELGAFNNVMPSSIIWALTESGLDPSTTRFDGKKKFCLNR